MTPQQRHAHIEEQRERRDLSAAYDVRERGARQEFAAWREAHPDFTSRELLDNWARIRRAWYLGPPEPKSGKRKTP